MISGLKRRPEEKIAYEENFLAEVLKNEFANLRLGETLPGFPGVPGKLLNILRTPWPADKPYWKNQVKGACQMLFFHTRPESAWLAGRIYGAGVLLYGQRPGFRTFLRVAIRPDGG